MGNISTHFNRSEFKCKCGNCEHIAVDHELLVILEDVRIWFDEPVTITSGNRCSDHNTKIGGAEKSKHLYSLAADIKVSNISTDEVYRYLDTKYPSKYGIGVYDNWVHIDVREGPPVRWDKR